ncbi:DUF456 domain-containing protein [Staphylococcus pasteuri]|uniref:DUF456 domain-containing protein n=1 Tax=Staphylococcus pasteuri TaxID=45972 RepID=A0ABY1H881_9STAP|nr:DUF456 domain-containing protein [Staphylococcus pasteuri]ATH63315.1 hypothetical protein BJG87_10145 [Staphylococcus pasteuri]KKI56724.1 putative membrane protein [Staphylococcus pasteuri]MCF7600468.1 DUF456 domain-containing protein [Staphylococcus pasteuri]MDI3232776.1 DUF456 domain-containing protein [Staphylococcus pasteuri]MEB6208005.1 DUF456 domain-containing protein [Staphylococcus pasteuri]
MTVLLWSLITIAFILAFVGLVKPVIPSVLVLWVGFLIYQFGFHNGRLSWMFYIAMVIFTIMIFLADFLMNKYFVGKYGGSKFGEYGAIIGVIIGCFVVPPFGIIIVPFVLVLIIELIQGYDLKKAIKVSFGSIIAFLASTIAQAIVMFIMVIWFIVDVFILN